MPGKRRCVKGEKRLWLSASRGDEEMAMKHADWMRMLEQLRDALDQTAAEVSRHEQTLASPLLTSDLSGERQVTWQRALERFAERLQECHAKSEIAGRDAQHAEAELARHEDQMRLFRAELKQAREQLGKPPTAACGFAP